MKLNREHEYLSVELYGGDDCFTTFYDSKNEDDVDAMIKNIKDSKEDIIQLEISIETITEEDVFNLVFRDLPTGGAPDPIFE